MGTQQKTSSLAILLTIMLLVTACATPTPIPTITSTIQASSPTLHPTETPIPPSATPAPPSSTPTPNISPTPNPTLVAVFISGLWEGSNGSYYLFKADGTWHWDEHRDRVENTPENTGKWWIKGNTFYIQDLTGKAKCPENQLGSYEPSLQDSKLKLIMISDKCEVRVPQTQGIYKLIP